MKVIISIVYAFQFLFCIVMPIGFINITWTEDDMNEVLKIIITLICVAVLIFVVMLMIRFYADLWSPVPQMI